MLMRMYTLCTPRKLSENKPQSILELQDARVASKPRNPNRHKGLGHIHMKTSRSKGEHAQLHDSLYPFKLIIYLVALLTQASLWLQIHVFHSISRSSSQNNYFQQWGLSYQIISSCTLSGNRFSEEHKTYPNWVHTLFFHESNGAWRRIPNIH